MRSEQTKNEEKRREKYRVVTSDGLVGWLVGSIQIKKQST